MSGARGGPPRSIHAIVVGYGSIGNRHARTLAALGHRVSVVSRREINHPNAYRDLRSALESRAADYVVVANETSGHRRTVSELRDLGFSGRILVEKPLGQPGDAPWPSADGEIFVGYNLRFDPVLAELRSRIAGKKVTTAEIRAASYLPDWRKGRDYRQTESARKRDGGGVLRDLSHELDYAQWIFGNLSRVTAIGGHFSSLEIETDDVFMILGESERCRAASISVNYIDRQPEERWIVANVEEGTYHADLMAHTLSLNGKIVYRMHPDEAARYDDLLYEREHSRLLSDDPGNACTLREGVATVALIQAIERAADRRAWIATGGEAE